MNKNRLFHQTLALIVAALVLLLIWEGGSLLFSNNLLPSPAASFQAFFRLSGQELGNHFIVSFNRVSVSILLGLVLGVPLGLYLGRQPSADRWAAPLIYLTYPIPKIVFLPVILLVLGIGDVSKIFLITIIVFYQIMVTARDSARSVAPQHVVSLQSLGANTWQIYRHVVIPACLPDVLTSLRISMGTAVSVLFFAESFATTEGLGYFIMDAWSRAASEEMFAGIIAMALLGLIMFLAVDLAEFYLCRWRRLQGSGQVSRF